MTLDLPSGESLHTAGTSERNMGQVTQALRSFFNLATSIKGRRATKIEFWVGFALLATALTMRNVVYATFGTGNQDQAPTWVLGVGAVTVIVFVVPFVTLCIRRLQDAGLNAWFFAVIVISLFVFRPAALVGILALGLLPSRPNSKAHMNKDLDPVRPLGDNPVIGFRLGRLMKMLGLLIGLPILLIVLLGIGSTLFE